MQGKVVIVTGAGSGIGAASAFAFAAAGASVVCAGRTLDSVRVTADKIVQEGGVAQALQTDVSDNASIGSLVDAAIGHFGRIDVLFNNAGISPSGRITDIDEAQWDECLDINLKGVFLASRQVIPHMRNRGGVILNTAGTFGLRPSTGKAAYAAAKAGVINLTRSIALDYARENIRCNAICPGFVNTPLTAFISDAERDAFLERSQPLPGVIQPEDVAELALWLASDAARMITGQAFIIDGGQQAGLFSP
ncbi:MAG: SDR family NAD(P)-dependent oxidoreductase [Anaerolineaceae bacterium]|nr:SDR family NAD(P)-dependent oxidoreductase [Anaerolineaceae bacterium]